jgi:murein DD-endopeptidase MepM/ murein hydrolase activator NlpD
VPRRLVARHRLPVVAAFGLALVALAALPLGLAPLAPPVGPLVQDRVVGAAAPAASDADAAAIEDARAIRPAPPAIARVGERGSAPAVGGLRGYRWPLAKGRLTLPFKAIPGGEFLNGSARWHDGVDLASFCGDRVVAAHDGVVLAAGRRFDDWIGWLGDLGPYYARLDRIHFWPNLPIVLVTDDGNGYRSVYAHFSRVVVRVGETVSAGQLVGYEGRTGHASGCHVHYGLFSPLETARFGVRADIVRRLATPAFEIARVDPLAVLPGGDVALRIRRFAEVTRAGAAALAGAAAPQLARR